MSCEIIGLTQWLKTPPGNYLLNWEHARFEEAVSDIFGYHALQLGLPELNALHANRMPHQWLALPSSSYPSLAPYSALLSMPATDCAQGLLPGGSTEVAPLSSRRAALMSDSAALPFPAGSLDLVVLPHTLELSADPHGTLREVERVLVPEGRVVISGFNPTSLWGLRQRRGRLYRRLGHGDLYLPDTAELIGYWRLRDWLRLLNFEVESGRFGCYRPALVSQQWLDRFGWMDGAGARWWPIFGAVYFLVAVKRVRGMRLLGPAWKTRKTPVKTPAVVASTSGKSGTRVPAA